MRSGDEIQGSKTLGGLLAVAALVAGWVLGCGPSAEPPAEPAAGGEPAAADDGSVAPASSPAGKWVAAREAAGPADAELKAIPYLQGYRTAGSRSGITVHEPGAFEGLNLYVSGHAAEAVLMDMEGTVLHRWRHPLRRLWPDLPRTPEIRKLEYWRRAHLLSDGSLLAIFETLGLVKLDRDSNVLWTYRSDVHHDLFVDEQGNVWVLDRRVRQVPRLDPKHGILEDLVTVLGPGGEVRRQISLLAAFERSAYRPLVADRRVRHGDVFHTNTLERLGGGLEQVHPAFREGNLLVSVLQLNTVAVVDPRRVEVVWALSGLWRSQHQPVLLPGGNLMVFDNRFAAGRSRVVEIDPLTQRRVWSYGGDPGNDFFSRTLGSCQRLPNGNTLITESENGRAFEVTPEGRIVWEFSSPHRAGDEDELVATLFEVVRLPPDFPFRG